MMTYVAKMQETHFQAFNRDDNNNDNKENKINYFFQPDQRSDPFGWIF